MSPIAHDNSSSGGSLTACGAHLTASCTAASIADLSASARTTTVGLAAHKVAGRLAAAVAAAADCEADMAVAMFRSKAGLLWFLHSSKHHRIQ